MEQRREISLKSKKELMDYPDMPARTNNWDRLPPELKLMILSKAEEAETREAQTYWKVSPRL